MLHQSIKKSRPEKSNYPLVSLLNNSKTVERCRHRQILEYFETLLSRFECGFPKRYNTQDFLSAMVENCKKHWIMGTNTVPY